MSGGRSPWFLLQFDDKGLETANGAVLDLVHGVSSEAEVRGDGLGLFAADGDAGEDLLRLGLNAWIGEEAPQGDFIRGLLPDVNGKGGLGVCLRGWIVRKAFATCRFPILVPQPVDSEESKDAGQVVVEGTFGLGVVLIGLQSFDEDEESVLDEVVRFEGREVPRGVIAQAGRVLVEELGPARGAGSATDSRKQLARGDGEWMVHLREDYTTPVKVKNSRKIINDFAGRFIRGMRVPLSWKGMFGLEFRHDRMKIWYNASNNSLSVLRIGWLK